ncbi:hypothetical protein L484_020185 [Morus notabilis]|uniref:Uncharacterized protein n=1 Tax=Morus notabilis TaxID=981085 RepID=W9QN57_9ROSA|nr:hypothetical protein L484_020185 [Morus notabilis]
MADKTKVLLPCMNLWRWLPLHNGDGDLQCSSSAQMFGGGFPCTTAMTNSQTPTSSQCIGLKGECTVEREEREKEISVDLQREEIGKKRKKYKKA